MTDGRGRAQWLWLAVGMSASLLPAPGLSLTVAQEHAPAGAYSKHVEELLRSGKWRGLTSLASEARSSRDTLSPCLPVLFEFHSVIRRFSAGRVDVEIRNQMGRLKAWHEATPDEPAPLIALAWLSAYQASQVTGPALSATLSGAAAKSAAAVGRGRWTSGLSPRKRALRSSLLAEAHRWLNQAKALAQADPQSAVVELWLVALEGGTRADLDAVFGRGIKMDPDYTPLYSDMAWWLDPSSIGKPGDVGCFARSVADRLKRDEQLLPIYMSALRHAAGRAPYRASGTDWRLVERGIAALRVRYPGSAWLLNQEAYLAWRTGRRRLAASLIHQIGDDWDSWVWKSSDEFKRARAESKTMDEAKLFTFGILGGLVVVAVLAVGVAGWQAKRDTRRMARGAGLRARGADVRLVFRGKPSPLLRIMMVNLLLSIVTLGVYGFWGRARTRRYLWSAMDMERDAFAYHGTGGETLRGFSKAFVMFGVPYGVAILVPHVIHLSPKMLVAIQLASFALLFLFIPFAMAGARRYRLSRTSWRGVRFGFTGRGPEFAQLYWWHGLLSVVTLGLREPWFRAATWGYLWSRSRFGSLRFRFTAAPRELLRARMLMQAQILGAVLSFGGAAVVGVMLKKPILIYSTVIVGWVGAMLWMGYATFSYRRRQAVWLWEHTAVSAARFRFDATLAQYVWQVVGNYLLLLLTLGFAWPWVQVRTGAFYARHLSITGSVDLDAVKQSRGDVRGVSASGDDYAAMFDLDLDLG